MDTEHFNKLLLRQIRRHLDSANQIPAELQPLMKAVSEAYDHYEKDRDLVQRSMDLSSQELTEVTGKLKEHAERLERSNAELKRFAYVAAHDLREPLRSISGFIQLLERREGASMSQEGREYMNFAVKGVHQMEQVLEGLLTYSKIEGGDLSAEALSLNELLDDVCLTLNSKISETNTVVEFSNLPTIQGDHSQVKRLFQNLIENSIKFCTQDKPHIHIESETADDDGFYRISLTDNGIGIQPKFREKVFSIFQRLHTREEYDGSGIGLAICKKIVERHGGEIWIDPQFDGGLRMRLLLPAAGLGTLAVKPLSDALLPNPDSESEQFQNAVKETLTGPEPEPAPRLVPTHPAEPKLEVVDSAQNQLKEELAAAPQVEAHLSEPDPADPNSNVISIFESDSASESASAQAEPDFPPKEPAPQAKANVTPFIRPIHVPIAEPATDDGASVAKPTEPRPVPIPMVAKAVPKTEEKPEPPVEPELPKAEIEIPAPIPDPAPPELDAPEVEATAETELAEPETKTGPETVPPPKTEEPKAAEEKSRFNIPVFVDSSPPPTPPGIKSPAAAEETPLKEAFAEEFAAKVEPETPAEAAPAKIEPPAQAIAAEAASAISNPELKIEPEPTKPDPSVEVALQNSAIEAPSEDLDAECSVSEPVVIEPVAVPTLDPVNLDEAKPETVAEAAIAEPISAAPPLPVPSSVPAPATPVEAASISEDEPDSENADAAEPVEAVVVEAPKESEPEVAASPEAENPVAGSPEAENGTEAQEESTKKAATPQTERIRPGGPAPLKPKPTVAPVVPIKRPKFNMAPPKKGT